MARFHRVRLAAPDGDWIDAYAALSDDGRLASDALVLVKSFWDGRLYYGELIQRPSDDNRITWGPHSRDSSTNLGKEPLVVGATIWVGETAEGPTPLYSFQVVEIAAHG